MIFSHGKNLISACGFLPFRYRRPMSTPRFLGEGRSFYHCVSRVVDRRFVFADDEKRVFRRILRLLEKFTGVRVVTYCLMSNHFHLLLDVPDRKELAPLTVDELLALLPELHDPVVAERIKGEIQQAQETDRIRASHTAPSSPESADERGTAALEVDISQGDLSQGDLSQDKIAEDAIFRDGPAQSSVAAILSRYERRRGDLSIFVGELKQRVTFYMNKRLDRVGTLWESRFKSVLVEGDEAALMAVAAYIDLNPVRAGIAPGPEDYPYSGYGEACSGGKDAALSREGLGRILRAAIGRRGQDPTATGESWRQTMARYRLFLYETGVALIGDPATGVEDRPGIAPEEVEALRERVMAAGRHAAEAAERAESGEPRAGPDGGESIDGGDKGDEMPESLPMLASAVGATLRGKQVRYFTDGAVFGTEPFVESVYEREKAAGRFGRNRRSGSRRLRGGNWGPLRVLRDLRKAVFRP